MKNLNLFDNILRETSTHYYEISSLNEKITSDTHKRGGNLSLDDVIADIASDAPWLSIAGQKIRSGTVSFIAAYNSKYDDDFVKIVDSNDNYDITLEDYIDGYKAFTSYYGAYVAGDDYKDLRAHCDKGRISGYTFVFVTVKKAV